MLEITALASSPAQVEDVVNCGADAVLVRLDSAAVRSHDGYFTRQELAAAIRFCHVRGVKVYVWLDSALTDESTAAIRADMEAACSCGADALRLEDAGAAHLARQLCPQMPIHAGTSLSAFSPYGAAALLGLGFSRISTGSDSEAFSTLLDQNRFIPELTVLSPGCSALSGRCYISSLRDKKPSPCQRACHSPFGYGRQGFYSPLCANPVCMIKTVEKFKGSQSAVLLDLTGLREDLAWPIVRAFRSAADGEPASGDISAYAAAAFGQASVYEPLDESPAFYANTPPASPKGAADGQRPHTLARTKIAFALIAAAGRPIELTCADEVDNIVTVEGTPCLTSGVVVPEAKLRTELYRTASTPYTTVAVRMNIQKGVAVSLEELAQLKERAILQLTALRGRSTPIPLQYYTAPIYPKEKSENPLIAVEVSKKSQLSRALADLKPDRLYLPLAQLIRSEREIALFIERGTEVSAVLPHRLSADTIDEVKAHLYMARDMGAAGVLAPCLDSAALAINEGFDVMADWGMNIKSSLTIAALAQLGIKSAAVSFELEYEKIEALSKQLSLEMIIYGRLPLIVTARPLETDQTSGIYDRVRGFHPLIGEGENCILGHSEILYLEKAQKYLSCGTNSLRLRFTGENERECERTLREFMSGRLKRPNSSTCGLYEKDRLSAIKEKLKRGIGK